MKKSNAQIPEGQKNIYKELIKMEPLKTGRILRWYPYWHLETSHSKQAVDCYSRQDSTSGTDSGGNLNY